MYALFKESIRTRLDWRTPAALTLLSTFVGLWEGRTWNGSVLIGYAIGSLFQATGVGFEFFLPLVYDGILQMFPLR